VPAPGGLLPERRAGAADGAARCRTCGAQGRAPCRGRVLRHRRWLLLGRSGAAQRASRALRRAQSWACGGTARRAAPARGAAGWRARPARGARAAAAAAAGRPRPRPPAPPPARAAAAARPPRPRTRPACLCASGRPCARLQGRGKPARRRRTGPQHTEARLRRPGRSPGNHAGLADGGLWASDAGQRRRRAAAGQAAKAGHSQMAGPGRPARRARHAGRGGARAPAPVATSQRSSRSASSGCGSAMPAAQKRVAMPICARGAPGVGAMPPACAGTRRALAGAAAHCKHSPCFGAGKKKACSMGACQTCASSRSGRTREAGAAQPASHARPAWRGPDGAPPSRSPRCRRLGARPAAVEVMLDLVLGQRPGALAGVALAGPVEPLPELHRMAGVREQLRLQRRQRALARLVRAWRPRGGAVTPRAGPSALLHAMRRAECSFCDALAAVRRETRGDPPLPLRASAAVGRAAGSPARDARGGARAALALPDALGGRRAASRRARSVTLGGGPGAHTVHHGHPQQMPPLPQPRLCGPARTGAQVCALSLKPLP